RCGCAIFRVQSVLHDQGLDARAFGRRNAGDDQVLGRGQAELALVDARDLAQAGEVRGARTVGDAPGRQRQGQVPAPVLALDPAEAVAVVVEMEGTRGFEAEAGALFHLRDDGVQAVVVDGVLEARVLAFDAVAEATLPGD